MKKSSRLKAIALAGAILLSGGQAAAQSKEKQGAAQPNMQEMMEKYLEAAAPGEPHKALQHFVGKWDLVARMWWEGPNKPSTEVKGTSEARWIMDGRFLVEEISSQMMGIPHKGMGITGYDNFKKRYVGFWIDSMGTGMYTLEGFFDQSRKVLTSYGKMDDPATGERDKMVKYVLRITDKDRHVFEIYDLVGSPGEFKVAEVTYTRKQ